METINLADFERINDALNSLLRMGDFMTCADPRAWNGAFNRLLDYCLDAGMDWNELCPIEWASHVIADALTGKIETIDEEA